MRNKRLSITLTPKLYNMIKREAKISKIPMSKVVVSLMMNSM